MAEPGFDLGSDPTCCGTGDPATVLNRLPWARWGRGVGGAVYLSCVLVCVRASSESSYLLPTAAGVARGPWGPLVGQWRVGRWVDRAVGSLPRRALPAAFSPHPAPRVLGHRLGPRLWSSPLSECRKSEERRGQRGDNRMSCLVSHTWDQRLPRPSPAPALLGPGPLASWCLVFGAGRGLAPVARKPWQGSPSETCRAAEQRGGLLSLHPPAGTGVFIHNLWSRFTPGDREQSVLELQRSDF